MLTKSLQRMRMNVFAMQTRSFSTVSFKVNTREQQDEKEILADQLAVKVWDNEHPEIYIPHEHKADPNPTWKAQKFNITYSSHKLALCAWTIRKMHLYDAIETITSVDKKGGPLVKSVLEAARHNGVKQGFSEERMFVKSITVGRAQGPKKIDIKGRGKMGFIRAPITSICLTMEEYSPMDMFKMIMKGKAPAGVGNVFRSILYQNDANFELVKQFSHMTTSNGRHYRKTQFKRLVLLVKKEYQKRGIKIADEKLERNLLEKAARDYIGLGQQAKEDTLLNTRATRQQHFEKSYKKQ